MIFLLQDLKRIFFFLGESLHCHWTAETFLYFLLYFLFPVCLTGSTGDRERCPHVLMANSQSDMEEWVRTLRRVIGAPTSGGSVKSVKDY